MANLPISTHKVGDFSLSWKELKDKAEDEARRIKAETIALAYNMIPSPMEVMKQSMDAIVDSATDMIDSKFKEETGMSITEAKYKLNDGIQTFKKYKELASSNASKVIDKKKKIDKKKAKEELVKKKAKIKGDMVKWLEQQTDQIYNAFFLVQAKDVIMEVKIVTAQMADAGTDLIREVIESLNNLKQFFPGGGEYKKQKPKEDVKLSIEFLDKDDGIASSMLSELAKSAASTKGDEYVSSVPLAKKGLSAMTKEILSLVKSLLALLTPFYTLVYNYNTNKYGLKEDGDIHSNEMLRGSAEKLGLTESVPYSGGAKRKVDISNTADKKKKREDIKERKEKQQKERGVKKSNTNGSVNNVESDSRNGSDDNLSNAGADVNNGDNGSLHSSGKKDGTLTDNQNSDDNGLDDIQIQGGFSDSIEFDDENTQSSNMEFMKFLNDIEDLDEMEIDEVSEDSTSMSSTSSSVMYVAPKNGFSEEILFSELDRVVAKIEDAKEKCKFNPEFPLRSISSVTDGGKVVNLEYAGDKKKELIESILNINGGKRM